MLYLGIIIGTHFALKAQFSDFKYINWAWVVGVVVMIVVYVSLRLIFEYILGLRHIGTFDELFLYDTSTNKSVITAILYFDKFDDKILTHLRNRMLRYRRLRSRFVQVFDSYYLKEFGIDRLMEVIEDTFVKVEVNA
jgi:hypothetical protein